jgi:parallel beta-helix repeat protein
VGNAISGNSISASGVGIVLFTGSSDNSVTGNSVKNSTDDGIYVYNSVRNTVSGNTVLNTTDDGIGIDSESHNNTVSSNTIDTAGGAGVFIIGIAGDEPTNNTVIGNSIINTGGSNWNYGIELGYAHKNTIANNRITDDSCSVTCYAISIRVTSATNYITNNTFNSTPGTSTIDNLATSTIYSDQPLAENGANITSRLSNSVAAFQIQNAAGSSLFTVDSTNSRLYVGAVAGDTTGTVLVLGNKTNAGNPTGVDGAMYYNSNSKSFECYKNGLWGDCNFASLRSEWVLQEDFIDAGVATATIGTYEWTLTDTSTATEAKVSAAADASNRDRWGIYQTTTAATAGSGNMLRLDPNGMAGTPSNMTVEFDHGPSNAAAANGTQTVVRIGLMNGTTTSADPTDGIYFQYDTTTTAGNWFMCAQNNNAVTCLDTGVARTTTINTYQRFKFVTNSTGASVEFFINEASVGTVSANLPANIRPIGPAIAMHTVDAVARAWKIDYYQIKRNLTTLR